MNTSSAFRVLRVFLQGALPPITVATVAPPTTWAIIVLVAVCLQGGFHALAQLFAEPPINSTPTVTPPPTPPPAPPVVTGGQEGNH